MATGSVLLSPGAAVFPDGSASNLGAGLTRRQGTEANPKKHFLTIDYDGAGALEHAWWSFVLPSIYASGGTLKINWMCNATTGTIRWQARVGAVTAADADTPLEHAQAAAATTTDLANAVEARRLVQSSITLTMDSAAAGDQIFLTLLRDSADVLDTLAVDGEVLGCEFQFTTT